MVPNLSSLIDPNKKPYAKLVSWTNHPVETVYAIWQFSKLTDFNKTPEQIHAFIQQRGTDAERLREEVFQTFSNVVSQGVPCAENVSFTFFLYNDPIAHREQMVRHRVGHKFGDNFAVDVIPEFNSSSWWSQTMRGVPFDKLFDDQRFFISETIKQNPETLEIYLQTMKHLQDQYTRLLEAGVPAEDARLILPLASTMNISWTLNLAALLHVLGKRSCWILQYSFWSYFIRSMANELSNKIHPIFNDIILPPCFKGMVGKKSFSIDACNLNFENDIRFNGSDIETPCALHVYHKRSVEERRKFALTFPEKFHQIKIRSPRYAALWQHDPVSGDALDKEGVQNYKFDEEAFLS